MFLRITAFCLCVFAITGCSKLTAENYHKVKAGMEYQEVTEILGGPDECSEMIGTKQCRWGDDAKNIKITFVADRATLTTQTNVK